MKSIFTTAVLTAALACGSAVHGVGFEDTARLDALVIAATGADIGAPGGPRTHIDPKLHLAACPQAPVVEGPVFGAAVVRCEALGWRIRVPLIADGGLTAARPQKAEIVVKRGDPIELTAGGSAFAVTAMMIADEEGAVGDTIRMRADRKAAPVSGQIVQAGHAVVPGFQ